MNQQTRFTVIGSGHGSKAMAADLAARDFTVNLYSRSAECINEIALRGEIELEYKDGVHRLGRLAVVTRMPFPWLPCRPYAPATC